MEFPRVSGISKGMKTKKIPEGFTKKYVLNLPMLIFFWNAREFLSTR